MPEQERIEQNIRRTAGVVALRKIRSIVDDDLDEEELRVRWLRAFMRYGWIILLALAGLLARYLGVV